MALTDRRLRQIQTFFAGVALITLIAHTLSSTVYTKDLQQEYLSARALRDGVDIFTPTSQLSMRYFPFVTTNFPHPNPHPPVLVLLSVPLTFAPFPIIAAFWLACNLTLLVIIGRWLGLSGRASLALAAWPPLWWVLDIGQIEVPLLILAMLGWRAAGKGQDWQAGVWLGVVTALKFYPGLLLLPFLFRRRWRVLFAAGATILLGQIASLLVVGPTGMIRYFRVILPSAAGLYVRQGLNSSPYGALLRLFGGATDVAPLVPAPGLVVPLTITLSAIAILALLLLRPEAAPVAALVAMPNAWGYYAMLLLPDIVHLARHPSLRRPALVAAGAASVTLPVVNVLLLAIVPRLPAIGGVTPFLASPLASIQSIGYLALLVLAIKHDAPWHAWPAYTPARRYSPTTKPADFSRLAESARNLTPDAD